MSFFSKTRYMIGVGFKKLARTPVPKLPSSYPPPPPRGTCTHTCTYKGSMREICKQATQKDHKLVFKTNDRLMEVKSIAECSPFVLHRFYYNLVIWHCILTHATFISQSCSLLISTVPLSSPTPYQTQHIPTPSPSRPYSHK